MVLLDRIELSTSPLPMVCSTTELQQQSRRLAIAMADPQVSNVPVARLLPIATDIGLRYIDDFYRNRT
jgi:hypothetical protein